MSGRIIQVLVLPALLACLSCDRCGEQTPDEELITRLVDRAVELAEKHDIGGLMDLASSDFLARPGNHDGRETRRLLFLIFRRYRSIEILHPRPRVELDPSGERATARVVFLMLRRGQERPDLEGLGDDLDRWVERAADFARLYRLDLDLVKIDGDWLVQQARLER
ncbi:MAG: hypothetical protein DRI34_00130 [Deltaproteobacteria bacterium]|nr:MAG: hypothetical protein DRI34_00130 [Deltaproteobacteria bacterium]